MKKNSFKKKKKLIIVQVVAEQHYCVLCSARLGLIKQQIITLPGKERLTVKLQT